MGTLSFVRKIMVWLIFFMVVCVYFPVSNVMGQDTVFSWLPSSDPTVVGYKIHYGETSGGPYPNVVDVGMPEVVDGRMQGKVSGLACGKVYYLVCTSYTAQGVESDYSTQEEVRLDDAKPITPSDLILVQ